MEVKRLVLSVTLLMTVTPAAFADTPDWYLGGSLGRGDYSSVISGAADAGILCIGCTDGKSTAIGGSLIAGYRYNRYFALEGEYFDMGSDNSNIESGLNFNESVDFDLSGYGVAAIGSYPVTDDTALFGKLGLVDTKLEANTSGLSPGPNGGSFSEPRSATKFTYEAGVGVEFTLSPRWDLRLGYTLVHDVGEGFNLSGTGTGTGNVSFLYIGWLRHF